ncbi:uncharacterized protein ColSpa_09770 [Colletotrichum spaethianum]|uniref:Uncharacterized protein n=1 Tax=Colletotrichum spaethianum TaxID=700344 RepID=A0AA37UJG0_9PEZI|nr:uncharacterized protein ColSpa_09770 [Colletotrichum spaethianum]GKT49589.1 hypothetical protein ColSpa_09770 [Colletotrichum spaethianum]
MIPRNESTIAWGPFREDKGKQDLSYGMRVYDEARRKFLKNPTTLQHLGDNLPTYTRLWGLVDRWIELTTDGNPVLILDNGWAALDAGIGRTPLPFSTAYYLISACSDYMKSRNGQLNHDKMNEDEKLDTILTPGLKKLSLQVEDLLARENLQLAKRVRQLEGENEIMRPELNGLREANMKRRQQRRNFWMNEVIDYNSRQREQKKETFPMESLYGFLRWIEKKETVGL